MVKDEPKKKKVKIASKNAAKKKGGRKTVGQKDNSTSSAVPTINLSDDWPMATETPVIGPTDSNLTSKSSLVMKFLKADSDDSDGDDDFCFSGDNGETRSSTTAASSNNTKSAYEMDTSLVPGPCLHACSGADVQLARGANTKPNLDKAKGKFLIVLPGMMSFQHLKKPTTTMSSPIVTQESALTQESSNTIEMTQDTTNNEDDEEQDGTTTNSVGDSKSTKEPGTTKSTLPKLGKIENLGTDNPVLKIPFDGDGSSTDKNNGRVLVFSGKKIESSSKFMILTCKNSKQSVTCKDIFSSVIVFGEGKWEKQQGASVDSDIVLSSEEALEKSQSSIEIESEPPSSMEEDSQFNHYGGSNRAVDGGKAISSSRRKSRLTSHKRKSGEGVQVNLKKPTETKKLDEEQENDSDSDSDDIEMVLENDGDDDEYVAPAVSNLSQDSVSRKQTPRRSVAKSPVNYADLLQESDNEEEDDLSESEKDNEEKSETSDQSSRPKRGRPPRKPTSSTVKKQPKKNNTVIDIDANSESSPESAPKRAKPATQKTKTVNTKKTPTKRKSTNIVEINDSSEDDYSEEENTSAISSKRKTTPRRSVTKTKVNYTVAGSDDENDEDESESAQEQSEDEDNDEVLVSKKTRKTRNTVAPKTPISAKKKPAPKKVRTSSKANKDNKEQASKKNRVSAVSKKNDPIEIIDDADGDASSEHDENRSPKDANKPNTQKLASKKKSPPRRSQTKASTKGTNKIAVKMGNKGKPLASKNLAEDDDERQEVKVNLVSSPAETPRSKGSRRKRKSPAKALKSPTKKKLIVNDDEFSFLD